MMGSMNKPLHPKDPRNRKPEPDYDCNECPESFKRIGHFHHHVETAHQTVVPRTR